MDPVHDRGSMDPVHESGAWTGSEVGVHVLSSPRCNSAVYRCQRVFHCSRNLQLLQPALLQLFSSAS